MGIVEELYRLAYEAFNKPVPKMPGLDELLAWLDEHHIPMAVASSSPMAVIEGHLEHWGLGHYFKAVISGEHLTRSKPAPDIFLLAAQKLGTEPAKTSRPPPTRCAGSIPASVLRSTRCAESSKAENYEPQQTRTTCEISAYHRTNINNPVITRLDLSAVSKLEALSEIHYNSGETTDFLRYEWSLHHEE